ncbi:hypothetical protein FACS1894184_20630 [Clostridia bacterium]|nr:hypothetical protein FACS1894184_20630 [Clostridia bacterium]
MLIKFTKVSVLLPIAIGMLLGAVFFWLGLSADAPGACVIGLALAFGLSMLGVHNADVIKKGLLAPTVLFCYALGVTILNISLILNGELEEYPNMAYIGFLLGGAMLSVGVFLLSLRRKRQSGEDNA